MSKTWTLKDQRQLTSKVGWVRFYAHLHYMSHQRRAREAAEASTARHLARVQGKEG